MNSGTDGVKEEGLVCVSGISWLPINDAPQVFVDKFFFKLTLNVLRRVGRYFLI